MSIFNKEARTLEYEYSDNAVRALEALPRDDVRAKYTLEELGDYRKPGQREGTWSGRSLRIKDAKSGETIYEYTRNYPSNFQNFEVFRQWDGEKWHDYAVISPDYLGFAIIDLESREIVAQTADDDVHSFSFCPTDFFIPDFWDAYPMEELEEELAKGGADAEYCYEAMETFLARRTFGFSLGTVWGDDWSMKVQQLDFYGLSEGKARIAEAFGYCPINVSLREAVGMAEGKYSEMNYFISSDQWNLEIATFNSFRMEDGGKVTRTFENFISPETIKKSREEYEAKKAKEEAEAANNSAE